ncbi:dihydroneopterin aldolase [Bradyrhizobium sp.]|uniref:dihydroneopterin aldolase n=1 Tax=Bradyrhizobium sp. TaxID=376 RepID=UPI003C55164E
MLTSIAIAGLQTYGYHGLFEEERTLGQKFNFDISATLREVRTHLGDNLDCSVRYDAVIDEALQIAGSGRFQTLEALAEMIATGLLRRFAAIDGVTVAVAKFSPPIVHSIEQVRVEVRLQRADLAPDQGETAHASASPQYFGVRDQDTRRGSRCP